MQDTLKYESYLNHTNIINGIKSQGVPLYCLYQYFLIQTYMCLHKQHIFISSEGVGPDRKLWFKQYSFHRVRSFFICGFRNDVAGLFQCILEPGRQWKLSSIFFVSIYFFSTYICWVHSDSKIWIPHITWNSKTLKKLWW